MSTISSTVDADVMVETRSLLNSLNAENAELKEYNHDLNNKLRQLSDDLEKEKRNYVELENDTRELNFNLMQQLQKKAVEMKAVEAKEEDAKSKVRDLEAKLRRAKDEIDDLKSINAGLEERHLTLDGRLSKSHEDTQAAQREAARYCEELNEALANQREQSVSEHKENRMLVANLRHELGKVKAERDDILANKEECEETLRIRTQQFHSEKEKLIQDAARTHQAESEAHFSHDQLMGVADLVFNQMEDMCRRVRNTCGMCEENDAAIAIGLSALQEQRGNMEGFIESTDALINNLMDRNNRLERELEGRAHECDEVKRAKHHCQESVTQSQKQVIELQRVLTERDLQLEHEKEDHARLKLELHALKGKCSENDHQIDELKEVVSGQRSQLHDAAAGVRAAEERVAAAEQQASNERTAMMQKLEAVELKLAQQTKHFRDAHASWESEKDQMRRETRELRHRIEEHVSLLASAARVLQQPLATSETSGSMIVPGNISSAFGNSHYKNRDVSPPMMSSSSTQQQRQHHSVSGQNHHHSQQPQGDHNSKHYSPPAAQPQQHQQPSFHGSSNHRDASSPPPVAAHHFNQQLPSSSSASRGQQQQQQHAYDGSTPPPKNEEPPLNFNFPVSSRLKELREAHHQQQQHREHIQHQHHRDQEGCRTSPPQPKGGGEDRFAVPSSLSTRR